MKKFILGLMLALTLVITETKPVYAVNYAAYTRNVLNGTVQPSVTNTWLAVIASTQKQIKAISAFNSGTVGIIIGIGASGSEVAQFVIPPSMYPMLGPTTAQVYPIHISQSQQISIQSLGSTGNIGEVQLNYFYY